MLGLKIGMWTVGKTTIYSDNSVNPVQSIYISDLPHKIDGYNGRVYSWPVFLGSKDYCSEEQAINFLKIINILVKEKNDMLTRNTIKEIKLVCQDKLAG